MDESGIPNVFTEDPIFCLAGVIVHSKYISLISETWGKLMRECFGDENFIFHSSSDLVKNSKHIHQKILDFCKLPIFSRFAVGYHEKSLIDYPLTQYRVCSDFLKQKTFPRLIQYYPFSKIVLIFEDCERDRNLIQESFNDLEYNI